MMDRIKNRSDERKKKNHGLREWTCTGIQKNKLESWR